MSSILKIHKLYTYTFSILIILCISTAQAAISDPNLPIRWYAADHTGNPIHVKITSSYDTPDLNDPSIMLNKPQSEIVEEYLPGDGSVSQTKNGRFMQSNTNFILSIGKTQYYNYWTGLVRMYKSSSGDVDWYKIPNIQCQLTYADYIVMRDYGTSIIVQIKKKDVFNGYKVVIVKPDSKNCEAALTKISKSQAKAEFGNTLWGGKL